MLGGLQYVTVQIAVSVAVAALLAGILGWLLGRASGTRRAAKVLASAPASRLQPALGPATARPPAVVEPIAPAVGVMPSVAAAVAPVAVVADPLPEPIAYIPTHAFIEPPDDEDDEDPDPDRTVLRPAPSFGSATTPYMPPRFALVTSTLRERELTNGVLSSVQEEELRREVRAKELELGKLEAGVLSAWDRTVPALEAQISDLQDENVSLRRQIREAEEHSDADAQTVERLRSLVAERDTRLAEIRARS